MLELRALDSVTSFSGEHAPRATVEIGEPFACETVDCYAGQITGEDVLRPQIDMRSFNRATGPVRIAGVRAGDAIRIVIERIDVDSTGVMALAPGLGVLGEKISAPETRMVRISDGIARIAPGVEIPITPMVGVIGVAPSRGGELPNAFPGDHGGNLDTRILTAGSSLLVRANRPGALVSVGDLHALQGDGELGGTGIEIGGRVVLRVERAEYTGTLPAVANTTGLSILGTAETLEAAVRRAFSEAVELISEWHGLPWNDAYRLTSLIARTEISQMVNPLSTIRITLPREWVPGTVLTWPGAGAAVAPSATAPGAEDQE